MSQIYNNAVGTGTGDGGTQFINLGYLPSSVRIINATTFTEYYWNSDLGTDCFVRSNVGALTIDNTGLIAPVAVPSTGTEPNTISISAIAIGPGQNYTYEIIR